MELIEELKNRYKELCSMLNIGMYKIEVYAAAHLEENQPLRPGLLPAGDRRPQHSPTRAPAAPDVRRHGHRRRDADVGLRCSAGNPVRPHHHQVGSGLAAGSDRYTAKMQVRWSVNDPDAVLTLTDGDGLTLGGPDGTVTIHIDASALTNLPYRTYVYDLEVYSPMQFQPASYAATLQTPR